MMPIIRLINLIETNQHQKLPHGTLCLKQLKDANTETTLYESKYVDEPLLENIVLP